MSVARTGARSGVIAALVMGVSLLGLVFLSCLKGTTTTFGSDEFLQGLGGILGTDAPLEGYRQLVFELVTCKTLVACGVGASLACSGALLQGVFRNGLASPSILGITAGAGLGATLGIMLVGGYGSNVAGGIDLLDQAAKHSPLLVTITGFVGACSVALLVAAIGGVAGRVSVPTLLLVGIAINACIAGILAAIQAWLVQHDWQTAEAVYHWSFGSLKDKSWTQVGIVWTGAACAALALPFVARELDLFAAGEENAESLGVNTTRTKLLALVTASLAASAAVAVAGQIAFVGLVVPHLVRLAGFRSYRTLLPLSLVGGAIFLLGADVAQRYLMERELFKPGVLMSMVGGPFFLFLLVRSRSEVRTW
jgi:iron complex transport system permease protein